MLNEKKREEKELINLIKGCEFALVTTDKGVGVLGDTLEIVLLILRLIKGIQIQLPKEEREEFIEAIVKSLEDEEINRKLEKEFNNSKKVV